MVMVEEEKWVNILMEFDLKNYPDSDDCNALGHQIIIVSAALS